MIIFLTIQRSFRRCPDFGIYFVQIVIELSYCQQPWRRHDFFVGRVMSQMGAYNGFNLQPISKALQKLLKFFIRISYEQVMDSFYITSEESAIRHLMIKHLGSSINVRILISKETKKTLFRVNYAVPPSSSNMKSHKELDLQLSR